MGVWPGLKLRSGLYLLKDAINPWFLNETGFYSEEAYIRGNTVLVSDKEDKFPQNRAKSNSCVVMYHIRIKYKTRAKDVNLVPLLDRSNVIE